MHLDFGPLWRGDIAVAFHKSKSCIFLESNGKHLDFDHLTDMRDAKISFSCGNHIFIKKCRKNAFGKNFIMKIIKFSEIHPNLFC